MTEENLQEAYEFVIDSLTSELDELKKKAEAAVVLSDKMAHERDSVERNDLLDLKLKLDGMKTLTSKVEKLLKSCASWADDAILLRLEQEELDNYAYLGKMFYPSTNVYPSVADRGALETYIIEEGALDLLGNTLNREVVNNHLERTGSLPPGVNSITKKRLNCRNR